MAAPERDGLFDRPAPAPTPVGGVRGVRADPASNDLALTGDGYGWLAALLPVPTAPVCGSCGVVMVLGLAAPVLWTCPTCHPAEVR